MAATYDIYEKLLDIAEKHWCPMYCDGRSTDKDEDRLALLAMLDEMKAVVDANTTNQSVRETFRRLCDNMRFVRLGLPE